jgi:hypothetical protein
MLTMHCDVFVTKVSCGKFPTLFYAAAGRTQRCHHGICTRSAVGFAARCRQQGSAAAMLPVVKFDFASENGAGLANCPSDLRLGDNIDRHGQATTGAVGAVEMKIGSGRLQHYFCNGNFLPR